MSTLANQIQEENTHYFLSVKMPPEKTADLLFHSYLKFFCFFWKNILNFSLHYSLMYQQSDSEKCQVRTSVLYTCANVIRCYWSAGSQTAENENEPVIVKHG